MVEEIFCENCGQVACIVTDVNGQVVSYPHLTFDLIEGIDFARYTCTKRENTHGPRRDHEAR